MIYIRYFDDDEEPVPELAYIPAPGSPSAQQDEESDDDPLDAFMAGIEKQVERESIAPPQQTPRNKGTRADIDDMDDEESYYK